MLAWDQFKKNSWRANRAGLSGAVYSFDLRTARRKMLAADCDSEVTDDLLGACETGALMALREREGDEDGGEN